jgi:nicotinate-nucleotide--dimethylbenzimidazole phosphoribosyltransferase
LSFDWLQQSIASPSQALRDQALARQASLTKPPGSLGRLEEAAVRLASLQGREAPLLDNIRIVVFAADHGVVEEGVSLFPQAVTVEMIKNFASGGAAISVLARSLGAELEVVDVGAANPVDVLPGVVSQRAADGTRNLRKQAAMSETELAAALAAGRDAAGRGVDAGMQLFIGGLLGLDAAALAGPGTGLNAEGVAHKARIIDEALALHKDQLGEPLSVLQHLGGFELAALAGAYIAAAQAGVAVLVDGFIATAAALVALRLRPELGEWLFLAHASAEPGHRAMVEAIGQAPLLDLGMRLGEGSGAAVAVNILRSAVALHNGMATFAEAGVSEGDAA